MKKKIVLNVIAIGTLATLAGCSNSEEALGYSGFVEGKKVQIQSEFTSKISEIHIEESLEVKNGDELITLDTEQLDLEIANAKAAIDIANAKKEEAEDTGRDYLIDQAEGALKQAENNLKILELQKIRSILKAPIEGVIQDIHITEGEVANSNETLVSIIDNSSKEVTIYVDEKDLSSIEKDKKIKMKSDAYNSKTFVGIVKRIATEAEFTPQNVQTKEERAKRVFAVTIDVSKVEELKSGMSVDIDL